MSTVQPDGQLNLKSFNVTDKTSSDMQHYLENDLKLRKFVPIIQQSVVYPVIMDANRIVLSLPPIINGAHSAVRALNPPRFTFICWAVHMSVMAAFS